MTQPAAQQTVSVQAPPQDSETVQHIAEILLAAYAADKAARLIAALIPSMKLPAIKLALQISARTAHQPNARLNGNAPGTVAVQLARRQARQEVFYRAAYVVNAGKRIQEDLDNGESLSEIVAAETSIFAQHQDARNDRLDAATQVGQAADDFGPILGWYHDPLLNNEPECLTASGHNFDIDEGTLIGWPGAVHPNCGCTAGPPIPGAGMVNDALVNSPQIVLPRKFKLRKAG